MPKLDKTGPEGRGSKTGRKLGECHKNEAEQKETGELGKGQGKRRYSGGGKGNRGVLNISGIRNLLKTSGYSDRAIEYYENYLNVGSIENPDAQSIFTGPCGDTMEIFLKITSDVITDAKFQAIGCAGSFTSGSALTKMINGKTLMDCEKLDENDVLDHLGAMPEQKVHCARLAILTLKKAIEQYNKKE